MRIVFLSEQYPPYIVDGAGTYTFQAARALAAIGHEVHVLCAKGTRIRDELDAGVHVHRRPPLRVPLAKLPGPLGRRFLPKRDSLGLRATLACSYAFWLQALKLEPDVIETYESETRGLWTAVLRDVPLVIHLHSPVMLDNRLRYGQLTSKERLIDALDRYSVQRADLLTAPSELLVKTLREQAWLEPEREVIVIPYPFDATPYAQVPGPLLTSPTILSVGRLEWRKAPETLLAASVLLRRRGIDARLVLAGRSDGVIEGRCYAEWLEAEARRTDVPCQLVGHVDGDALRALYSQARVVALPSRFDNYPMVALEAMACGRPIVTTTKTGVASLVARASPSDVVAPDDPPALADALAPYLVEPSAAAASGERARRALAEIEPSRIARLREAVYARAIALHRGRDGRRLALPGRVDRTRRPASAPADVRGRVADGTS